VKITVLPSTENWVTIGSSLVITCQVIEGSLPIELSLTHPSSEERDVSSNITAINSSITISIDSASDNDYGNYTCEASNNAGVENQTIFIKRGGKLRILTC